MRTLTTVAQKRRLFADDVYYRDAWSDVDRVLGPSAEDILQRLALVVFKPECVATHRVADALSVLHAAGFDPLYWTAFTHDRLSVRDLWRYRWPALSLDRLHLTEAQNSAGPSLLLIATYRGPIREVPATVVLHRIKGPSDPARRSPEHLRSRLGSANALINYLHAADEPIDLVREWGVLLAADERSHMLETLARRIAEPPRPSAVADVAESARALVGDAPPPDLDYGRNRTRLDAAIAAAEHPAAGAAARIRALLGAAEAGEEFAWRRFVAEMRSVDPAWSRWSLIVIGAELTSRAITPPPPPTPMLIEDDGADRWWRGEGAMVAS